MTAAFSKALREILAPMDASFEAFSHDYPFPYSGWHYHPEYEIHLITKSKGSFYVGTFAGEFEPGNLVMTGPLLPHMWVSTDSGDDWDPIRKQIPERDVVVHFSERFAASCLQSFEDCASLKTLLDEAHSGVQLSSKTSRRAGVILEDLMEARGLDRLARFFRLISVLADDPDRRCLSFALPQGPMKMAGRLNAVLAYIADNFSRSDLTCASIAAAHDMSPSALSRAFEKHANCPCVEYINRLRVYKACQLLAETEVPVTTICYDVGYDVLSTFNRNFLRFIGTTPSEFRARRAFGPDGKQRFDQTNSRLGGALMAGDIRAASGRPNLVPGASALYKKID
ncbi:AraC family transcriptional regulator [Consotaella salsifontis]|uniref:Transcriptional regulator, AraC family n=1 Tax=Consotaella salsifontis TaxID=1365950 RepID=A0A1T4SJK1_9HYPH|nr:helix-turn-helix domain-containing protein [Consotaella salsifontis]SKA28021.1 transcriptional regulator, AraC family [Consotaella salsifontis]